MSQPEVSPAAQRAYDQLPQAWRARDNDTDGWLLLALVVGCISPLEEAWAILEDPGPRDFFNPDTVPAKWLPWLADRNGARLAESMTEQQRRDEIKNPTGWRRVLPISIVEAATKYLPDDAVFLFRERTNPDTPGDQPAHVALTLHEDDITPGDEDDILASFEQTIPIGMFGHLLIVGQWWAEDTALHATNAAAATAHATHAHAAEGH